MRESILLLFTSMKTCLPDRRAGCLQYVTTFRVTVTPKPLRPKASPCISFQYSKGVDKNNLMSKNKTIETQNSVAYTNSPSVLFPRSYNYMFFCLAVSTNSCFENKR